jgi:hypothetical protein
VKHLALMERAGSSGCSRLSMMLGCHSVYGGMGIGSRISIEPSALM